MRLLVLGGSGFVGRACAEEAVARGDEVTVLNRGRAPAPAGVDARVGDRTEPDGFAALGDERFDAVVDTWSGPPSVVRRAAEALADRVGHWTYVSSRSVYAFPAAAGADESAPLVALPDDLDAGDYAQVKRASEIAVDEVTGGAQHLRAGLILGPHEDVGRLPWWLLRAARGGPMVAPGPADLPLQLVDARDLATFALDGAVAGRRGPVNVVSPSGHATTGSLLDAVVAVTGGSADLHWVEPEVLVDAGVAPWTELPIWVPPGELHDALHRSDVSAAVAAGLRCRPVEDTVADTWDWLSALDGAAPQRPDRPAVGLDAAREEEILAGRAG